MTDNATREVAMAILPGSECALAIRDGIKRLENHMLGMPQVEIPVTHTFCGATYVRSIVIPKGVVATGRRHRHSSIHLVMLGRMTVVTEGGGRRDVEAGSIFVSPPGAKMAGIAHEDCIWATAHTVGDERDIKAIEASLCYSEPEDAALFPTAPASAEQVEG